MKGLKLVFGVVTLFFGLALFANLNCFSIQSDLIEEEDFQQEVDLQAGVGSNTYASANVGKVPMRMDTWGMGYLSSSGYLYAAGYNAYGGLGNGRYSGDGLGVIGTSGEYTSDDDSYEGTPFAVQRGAYVGSSTAYFQNPKDYAFGVFNSAVVASDGTLWTAGYGAYGMLGNGSTSAQYTYEQARYSASSYVTNAVSVSMGYAQTLMMNSSGHLYAAGYSNRFGNTSNSSVSYFTRIDNNSTYFTTEMQSKTVKDFVSGGWGSYILFTDGTLYGCYSSSGFYLVDSGVAMIDTDSYSSSCFYLKSDGMYYASVSSAGVVTNTKLVSMTSSVAATVVQIRGYSSLQYGYLTSSGALYLNDPYYGAGEISTATAIGVAYFDIGRYTFGYVTTGGVFYRWGDGNYGRLGNGSADNVLFSAKISLSIGISYIPDFGIPLGIESTPPA